MEEDLQTIEVASIYDLNHLKSIIASLKAALNVAVTDRDNNKKMRLENWEKHERDIRIIGEALIQEAEDRDWCSAYDDFVEELNRSLTIELKTREKEYEVEIEVTQKRTQRVTVTISANSEAHARELIEDDPSNYYEEKISNYDWDLEDEDSDIVDVTEA